MPLEKAGDLMETRDPEPDTCQTISSASELEAEKRQGGSGTTAPEKQGCVTEEIANSPQAEMGGKDKYPSPCLWVVVSTFFYLCFHCSHFCMYHLCLRIHFKHF